VYAKVSVTVLKLHGVEYIQKDSILPKRNWSSAWSPKDMYRVQIFKILAFSWF